jgi:hypothetical protein
MTLGVVEGYEIEGGALVFLAAWLENIRVKIGEI